ncbi:MAG: NAD(P)H-dependent glycerol-3-phosphate dehydrogenase [Thermoanaerobaculia bacterium]
MKISIIGAGAFGTAMAITAARSGNDVLLWTHEREVADAVNSAHANEMYLPGFTLDAGIRGTVDLAEAAAFSDVVFMLVPSQFYRGVLAGLASHLDRPVRIISGTKGIENESLQRMSEIATAVLGDKLRAFAAMSGPTFAHEVAKGEPTAAVIASDDGEFAREAQAALSCPTFRLYHGKDVVGLELAGALKNVIAIAAGVLQGLGLGYNTNAALVTRGLAEITRLGIALGGRLETFAGLAGMGDLVLTCTGSLSRNRSVGVQLGQGQQLSEILDEARFVAEGVKTSKSVDELARKHQIEMPISQEMVRVLYGGESPREAIQRLMTRALKAEHA